MIPIDVHKKMSDERVEELVAEMTNALSRRGQLTQDEQTISECLDYIIALRERLRAWRAWDECETGSERRMNELGEWDNKTRM